MNSLSRIQFFAIAAIPAFLLAFHCTGIAQQAQPEASHTFTVSTLLSFTGTTGAAPGSAVYYNSLIQASDGNFYGMVDYGGAYNMGVVYKLNPNGDYTLLHTFAGGGSDGVYPAGGLVQGTDGNLYGTTQEGGPRSSGTVFQITPSGTFTLLHAFVGSDGDNPDTPLVQGTDGSFYGTALTGGANNFGVAFKISSTGTFTLLHSFAAGPLDGANPVGLMQASDGNFYGAADLGGANGVGAIYSMTSSGAVMLLHSFDGAGDGADTAGALFQGTDGDLYSMALYGGAENYGTLFKISTAGAFTLLHTFTGVAPDGAFPIDPLRQGSDGNFYGVTDQGGGDYEADGSVFQMTPAGTTTTIYSFAESLTDSYTPYSGLIQGQDGSFYGTTMNGGTSGDGAIYKVTASPALPPPVQFTIPSALDAGASFNLTYLVTNAISDTMQQCFATNTAGDATWTGIKTGSATLTTVALTASSTPGVYSYSLTCGGIESSVEDMSVGGAKAQAVAHLALGSPVYAGASLVTATAYVSAPNIGALTGSVTFLYNSAVLGTVPVINGTASLNLEASTVPAGTYPITAEYSGNSLYKAASTTSDLVLQLDPTEIEYFSVTPSGGTVTFSAEVIKTAGSGIEPSEDVNYYYNNTLLASSPVSEGVTVTVPSNTPPGIYPIIAKYPGDAINAPCVSQPQDLVIVTGTTTTVAATPNPVPANHALTLAAQVTEASGNQFPTGTVTFTVGPYKAGTATLNSGIAILYLSDVGIASGTYTVTASYSGDTINLESSAFASVTVQ